MAMRANKAGFLGAVAAGVTDILTKSIGAKESGFFSRWGWSQDTWSGETIDSQKSMMNDTVWACVHLIAEAVAALPLGFYERMPNGARKDSNHPLGDLLHSQPNGRMSAISFWTAVVASMLLWGNAYVEIERRRDGSIRALEFLMPDRVRLEWDRVTGALRYHYTPTTGAPEREIASRNMMHFKAFTLDGEVGLSAIQFGRNSIGSAIAQDKASDLTFKQASKATGIVTMDAVLKKEQRDQIREHVRVVSASGGVYVLEKGSKYEKIGFNPHDAELLQTRSFSVETICRWFRVPPVMVGHGDKQSSWPTSTEAQGAIFLRYVLRGIIGGIEQEIRRALLSPVERLTFFAEFSIEGLLRGDSAARANFYASALQNGWMTRNEVRRLENLPPVKGGDILTVQSAMVSLDNLGMAPQADNVRDALKNWLDAAEGVKNVAIPPTAD